MVVSHIVVVGDRPDDVRGALDFLADHDLVITSGGLGPTADDLTADVVAGWAGAKMVHDAPWRSGSGRWSSVCGGGCPSKKRRCGRGRASRRSCPSAPRCWSPSGRRRGCSWVLGRWSRCCRGRRASCRRCGRMPSRPRRCAAARVRGVVGAADPAFFPLAEPQIAATLREIGEVPFEVTTCLRRGELEVATVFEPDEAESYASFEAGAARATATSCSPTTARRSTKSSRGCSRGRRSRPPNPAPAA